ncbi:MAG: hypothetical protein B7X77_00735 [Caulobacter sp. 39-67-4]|nr:MAG: hypothetical protein B7X77_00735 [Caulobacter sp. 39-67-4]
MGAARGAAAGAGLAKASCPGGGGTSGLSVTRSACADAVAGDADVPKVDGCTGAPGAGARGAPGGAGGAGPTFAPMASRRRGSAEPST